TSIATVPSSAIGGVSGPASGRGCGTTWGRTSSTRTRSGSAWPIPGRATPQTRYVCGRPRRVPASLRAQRAGAQSDDWAHVVLEYRRMRAILHTSVLVPGTTTRFILHGTTASWMQRGLDRPERELIAALPPGNAAAADAEEHAVSIDGASGTETPTPIPRRDYPLFYSQIRRVIPRR